MSFPDIIGGGYALVCCMAGAYENKRVSGLSGWIFIYPDTGDNV
jgi:hypothetical protein